MNEKFEFAYRNEDDKAYGLAGMAISIASLDALDRITEIDLEADGPMITFSNHYYYSTSPSVSPKAVWNNLLRNLHLTTALVMGNVMARSVVRMGMPPIPVVFDEIKNIVREEGREICSLDEEEADILFDKVLRHSLRLFNNPRLHPAVTELARVISRRRRLGVLELAEELELLRI